MTISYNWLSEYLPVKVEPERLSKILTSIGLEVETMEKYKQEKPVAYEDVIFEIGLTPNRMDAMSHLGVAKDVCAYLIHHDKKPLKVKSPFSNTFKADNNSLPVQVTIENKNACQRYAGVTIHGLKVKASPDWLINRLQSIGLRPVNNIVDITNYILHETGQPLHAFDLEAVKGRKIVVQNLPAGTPFTTLDEKKRLLAAGDLMICHESAPMCIAGVFGGVESGVKESTTSIFLESAWFSPSEIRKTSLFHSLRTDAATRFEKGVDISNTVNALKRAALLIKEIAGGEISSDLVDIYPDPKPKTEVALKHHYLKKISGKNYHPDTIIKIVEALGFELIKEGMDEIWLKVPYNKPDITLGADIVEEVLRIDGLDNVEIPSSITITPSVEDDSRDAWKNKISAYLTGAGFSEIMTNSITNSAFYEEAMLKDAVKMMNSLSAELNIMRPSMLETGLQAIAYNINRRQTHLRFFEYGRTYLMEQTAAYTEREHLCLYITGQVTQDSWKGKGHLADIYYVKGLINNLLKLTGLDAHLLKPETINHMDNALGLKQGQEPLLMMGAVSASKLEQFGIKQPLYFVDINWQLLMTAITSRISYTELPRQLPVQRDLAIVIPKTLPYDLIESAVQKIGLSKLKDLQLFDIFESEKLGKGKKSMAVSFTFLDEEKTLTDQEIDGMMDKIMVSFEKELEAEIRK